MSLLQTSIDQVLKAYNNKNYKLLQQPYEINVFGVRKSNGKVNSFDDMVGILYKDYGETWNLKKYQATTDPGLYCLENPENINGTAILVPGQYIGSHKIGLHKGQYKALVQCGTVSVYRDKDKDAIIDIDPALIQSGIFGINIHRANPKQTSTQVDKWSAGCTVIANPLEFDDFIASAETHSKEYGNIFNYTLFNEEDLN